MLHQEKDLKEILWDRLTVENLINFIKCKHRSHAVRTITTDRSNLSFDYLIKNLFCEQRTTALVKQLHFADIYQRPHHKLEFTNVKKHFEDQ